MSFDLQIFFPHPAFPAQEWRDMLESFRSESCEVAFEEAGAADSRGAQSCCLIADRSVISIGVCSINDAPTSCAPADTRWRASISTTMGRSGLAWGSSLLFPIKPSCSSLVPLSTTASTIWAGVLNNRAGQVQIPGGSTPNGRSGTRWDLKRH
jgi:hypothetical protein